jgi:hypothetical protein
MNEDELYAFYAGCALIGILSSRGIIDMSTAHSAHLMAENMIDMGKTLKRESEKKNDND